MKEDTQKKVDAIIEEAKRDPAKGRYYVYESYKSRLQNICETSMQYERAIIALAKAMPFLILKEYCLLYFSNSTYCHPCSTVL